MLMIGITVSLIVLIFYPQIMAMMQVGFVSLETWFEQSLNQLRQGL